MAAPNVVVTVEDHERFQNELEAIGTETNAKLVYLIDKAGQQIASFGAMEGVDPTSLASLTAGNVAATEGLAQLIGESEFSTLFHEGERDNLHITLISNKIILLVMDGMVYILIEAYLVGSMNRFLCLNQQQCFYWVLA